MVDALHRCFGPGAVQFLLGGLSVTVIVLACLFVLARILSGRGAKRDEVCILIAGIVLLPALVFLIVSQGIGHAAPGMVYPGLLVLMLVVSVAICVSVVWFFRILLNGLPLASKEFREQAARRRTFVIRMTYSVLAFLTALSMSYETLSTTYDSGFEMLGQGQQLFSVFVNLQFVGIYLFMPAMTCNLLTTEKERDSLPLLFLTRLRPSGILVGKLVSRLVPMLLFISMSLPLFALAYSFGGFDQAYMWAAIWMLFVAAVQCASIGILCSSWFRSTVAAFMATYIFGFLWMFGPPILDEMVPVFRGIHRWFGQGLEASQFLGFHERNFTALFVPPVILEFSGGGENQFDTVIRSIPVFLMSLLLLVLARVVMFRRAFAPPRQLLLSLFRLLDRFFWWANRRFGGGVVLTHGDASLPGERPVAWRETSRRPLGTVRYLVRVLVALEFPVAFICAIAVVDDGNPTGPLSVLLYLVWILAVLLICAKSASLISSERSHQTLDVLLTTPLTNREILAEKVVAVRRLMAVLWVPFLTIYLFQFWLKSSVPRFVSNLNSEIPYGGESEYVLAYGVTAVVTTALYLSLVSWVSFLIGMKVRSQARAIFITMGIFVAWCLVPVVILIPFEVYPDEASTGHWLLLQFLSPMHMIGFNEYHVLQSPWWGLFFNTAIHGSILILVRLYCRGRVDQLFARVDSSRGQGPVAHASSRQPAIAAQA